MAGTVDDFIKRFGGQDTMDDREASQYLERFASTRPEDRDFDNDTMYSGATEYLGKLPENEFQQAAQNAYATATPAQQQGLMGSLMRAPEPRGRGRAWRTLWRRRAATDVARSIRPSGELCAPAAS